LLLDAPDRIAAAHLAYLEAGADCIASASYQASVEGFERRGLDHAEALRVIRRSIALATDVRDRFWAERGSEGERLRPLVAASVGPYGAFLADGSEYSGRYELDEDDLVEFHRERLRVLADAGADLIACETIPSGPEVRALDRLVARAGMPAWLSLSCDAGDRLCDGTRIRDAIGSLKADGWVAVGFNCTRPELAPELIGTIKQLTGLPVVAYPNSGESYDAAKKRWRAEPTVADFAAAAARWRDLGARLIGGCCRVGPDQIREIRAHLGSDR
jgi:homocysteine S-methyltransferase